MSILLGVFVVYANADLTVEEEGEDTCIEFEWGTSWWQGIFGPGRTRMAMVKLVGCVEEEFEHAEFEIVERRER